MVLLWREHRGRNYYDDTFDLRPRRSPGCVTASGHKWTCHISLVEVLPQIIPIRRTSYSRRYQPTRSCQENLVLTPIASSSRCRLSMRSLKLALLPRSMRFGVA